MDRRQFSQAMAGFTAALMAGNRGARGRANQIPLRRLGATGVELPILGLGGFHLGRSATQADAARLVETAFEQGVRLFDNAESYQRGRAESWLGRALEGIRGEAFVMSKTFSLEDRSAESARLHLEGSLERLGTDHLDLWQLHGVRSVADVDRAFRAGGAMEYITDAKRQGLVRFIGVSGHSSPAANLRALHYWDEGVRFDTMQMPINPIDFHQSSFQLEVLPELVRRDIGVIAMKTSAQSALVNERICSIEECQRYVWSLPVSVAVIGMETPAQVNENAARARAFETYSAAERETLLRRIETRADLGLEWYKD